MAKYVDYNGNNAFFINPYNFVNIDFSRKPERIAVEERKKDRSGVLHCELITKTAISIPDVAESDLSKKHKEYDFIRNSEGVPMIPGSSIRGVIRNVFEALTNSCMSTVDANQNITYRTKDVFKPGIIFMDENGEYHLFKAKRYIFVVKGGSYAYYDRNNVFSIDCEKLDQYQYGDMVYFSPVMSDGEETVFKTSNNYSTESVFIEEMTREKKNGLRQGYICIGEPFAKKKHFESVFERKEEIFLPKHESGKSVLSDAIKGLIDVVKIYNDEKINPNAKNSSFYKGRNYKRLEKGNYYPIWYKLIEENGKTINVHLSVANLGRSSYSKNMGDKLLGYKACENRKAVCPACSLFGMTGDTSLGSRIRFSDALMNKVVPKNPRVILKELSSPKISYMPFYLMSRNGNYDKNISYDNDAYVIRGRKFYWHNMNKNACIDPKRDSKNERSASVETIDKNSKFSFDVYYDNLSENEIKQLIWTLTLGENDLNGKQCHKVGHGKPIGLGSVKIVVTSQVERYYNNGDYSIKQSSWPVVSEDAFSAKNTLEQIKIITNLEKCQFPVDYPSIVNASGKKYVDGSNTHASHQWFTSNFSLGRSPEKVLPELEIINDEKYALKLKTDVRYNQGNRDKTAHKGGNPLGYQRYQVGMKYSGIISGYNDFLTKAKIVLDNGERAFVHYSKVLGARKGRINEVLKINEKILLIYWGKDERGYDQWEPV